MERMDALSPGAGSQAAVTRRGPLRRLGAWYRRHVWVATVLLLVVLGVAGVVALQVAAWERVGEGVTVAGVPLDGLSRRAAAAAVAAQVAPRLDTLRVASGSTEPLMLSLAQLGITVDAEATAQRAYAAGRRRLPLGLSLWLPGGAGEVAPVVRVDPTAYQKGLEAVRARVDVPARDAGLELSGARVVVTPSREGREVDGVALERAILATLAAGRGYAGPAPTKVVPPRVSTVEAQSRASAAATYLARPVTLRYRAREVVLTPGMMAGMLTVNTGADADTYPLTFRNDRARARLHRLFAFAEQLPVDATVKVNHDGTVHVVPSRGGAVLDMPVLLGDLDAAASGGGLRAIFVALTPAFPKLTTADVESMGLAALGSQFVTYFDPRKTERANNIALAARLVDGTLVGPGETFSLNAAMGPRTANRGFDVAPVIAADNVLRQGVGGGVCQYATTLFNAVFFAGLPVVERKAHSLYISHYPIGRDATVSWGSADFRFRNDTGKSLMIRSWIDGGALTVALVGKTGRKVSYTTSAFYDIQKPAHGKSDPRVIYDRDLGPGVIRWEKGIDGRSIKVERTVRDASGAVLFRDTFVSHYQPLDWIKRVGT
jgi:vancomycin resistance protein YoaR